MINIQHNNKSYLFRPAVDGDVTQICRLLNDSYKELADMGLNYTAATQDEKVTRERMSEGEAFVLLTEGEIVGTVLLSEKNLFTKRRTAYVGQFAIAPRLKKSGLGSLMMDFCEDLANEKKFVGIQLDTAKPASHLVEWYKKRGYKIVGETHWEGKTYDSWIFEKTLRAAFAK